MLGLRRLRMLGKQAVAEVNEAGAGGADRFDRVRDAYQEKLGRESQRA